MIKVLPFLLLGLISFTSQAQTINTYPYQTSFEGVDGTLNDNFPAGWTKEDFNGGIGNSGWEIIKNTPLAINANTDSTAVHMFSNMSETNNDWLYTVGFEMEASHSYNLSFWYNTNIFSGSSEKCKVHLGTDTLSTAMDSVPLWNEDNITNTSYQHATVTFSPDVTGVHHLGFHYYSDALSFVFLIDDVEVNEIITSIDEPNTTTLSLFPNPCVSHINITGLDEKDAYHLEVVDLTGRVLLRNDFVGEAYRLNTFNLNNGNYIIRVLSEGTLVQRSLFSVNK